MFTKHDIRSTTATELLIFCAASGACYIGGNILFQMIKQRRLTFKTHEMQEAVKRGVYQTLGHLRWSAALCKFLYVVEPWRIMRDMNLAKLFIGGSVIVLVCAARQCDDSEECTFLNMISKCIQGAGIMVENAVGAVLSIPCSWMN
jgi:hypothetical protein